MTSQRRDQQQLPCCIDVNGCWLVPLLGGVKWCKTDVWLDVQLLRIWQKREHKALPLNQIERRTVICYYCFKGCFGIHSFSPLKEWVLWCWTEIHSLLSETQHVFLAFTNDDPRAMWFPIEEFTCQSSHFTWSVFIVLLHCVSGLFLSKKFFQASKTNSKAHSSLSFVIDW